MSTVLYEATSKFDYTILTIPIIIIVALLLFPIVTKNYFEEKYAQHPSERFDPRFVKQFCLVGVVFVSAVTMIVLVVQLSMYHRTVGAYKRGDYQIVEGYVENFDPMPYSGHEHETFEIGGVKFSYSDYDHQPGYNNARSHGGVISGNGQHLKIGYVYLNETYGNIIVYIEQISD